MRCTACGTEVGDAQQYCTKCGARLFAAAGTSPPIQAKPTAASMLRLDQIIGQKSVVGRLAAICRFSRARATAAGHVLLTGSDGMGKRTIAHALAAECGVGLHELDASKMERKGDFTAVVTSLEPREILLVHSIGDFPAFLGQMFLDALQHERIDLLIGQGSGARVHPFQLNRFTCVATAQRVSDCPPELRDAFALTISLEPYSQSELEALAALISLRVGVKIDSGASKLISQVSGGVPRKIEMTIDRMAKLSPGVITEKDAAAILSAYGVKASTGGLSDPCADLQRLSGVQFEELISALLVRLGFRAQMPKASGDGGVDIEAQLDAPFIGGIYLIQCKRFSPKVQVGGPVVREFHGAVAARPKVVKGILITTSGFTSQARDFAHDVGIELIDGEQLGRLLAAQDLAGAGAPGAKSIVGLQATRPKSFLF
jgi:Holliday junction resolvasome RuvABC ATP-dependent DNA helicase subunit